MLAAGGKVAIQLGSVENWPTRAEDLPKGRFALTKVQLIFAGTKPKQPVENLESLAGLDYLASIETDGLLLQDENLAPLTSVPQLASLRMNKAALTDGAIDYVLAMKALVDFRPVACKGFAGTRLGELARTKISSISLMGCQLVPEAFPALRRLTALNYLALNFTNTTDADLALLADLKNLDTLYVSHPITLQALTDLKRLQKLHTFGWTLTPGRAVEEIAAIHRIFPDLRNFELNPPPGEQRVWQEAEFAAFEMFANIANMRTSGSAFGDEAARGVLNLKNLALVQTKGSSLTDTGLATLAEHKALEHITVESADVTDAGLLKLISAKSLRSVTVRNCPKITAAGLAAFQRARPDVAAKR